LTATSAHCAAGTAAAALGLETAASAADLCAASAAEPVSAEQSDMGAADCTSAAAGSAMVWTIGGSIGGWKAAAAELDGVAAALALCPMSG
jgi:hypothetical protein